MSHATIWDHAYIVSMCLGLLFAITKTQPQLKGQVFSTKDKISTYFGQSLFLYAIAIVAMALWYFAGRPMADLGLRWPDPDSWILYCGATGLFIAWFLIEAGRVFFSEAKFKETQERWKTLTPFMPNKKEEMSHAIHMAFAAGTCEEVVFRGFFTSYFALLIAGTNIWDIENPLLQWPVIAAVLIPAAIFSAAHLYQGWKMVGKIGGLAIVFGVIFVASKSLLIVVVLHFLIDLFACLVSPYLLPEDPENQPDPETDPEPELVESAFMTD